MIIIAALATPTSAMATTAPLPVDFLTEGEVELHTATESDEDFDPGTVYWEVQLQWSDGTYPYVATWERSEGSWASEDEAKAHFADAGIIDAITASRQCERSRIQEIAAGTSSYNEFHALSGDPGEEWTIAPDTWEEIEEACGYELQEEWEWAWEHTPSVHDEEGTGIVTVRIPIDVLGPGEHELFATPYGFVYEPSSELDELCRVHTWPNGYWVSRACRFEWLGSATTTVIVPEPPSAAPTDAPADAQESSAGLSATPLLVGAGVGLVVVVGVVVLIVLMRRRTRS